MAHGAALSSTCLWMYRTQRQSTTVVWPLVYLLAMATGKFGPRGFLWSKTYLQFETHCQRQAFWFSSFSGAWKQMGTRKQWALCLPFTPPSPILPPLVVSSTHWHGQHSPAMWDKLGFDWWIAFPFSFSIASFLCPTKKNCTEWN